MRGEFRADIAVSETNSGTTAFGFRRQGSLTLLGEFECTLLNQIANLDGFGLPVIVE